MNVCIKPVSGEAILPWLDALARLRIEVFREWPYLYEGTEDYESRYLRHYAASDHGLIVLALDGNRVVGASSGLPLVDADPDFQAALRKRGGNLDTIFYFGESVLDSRYRGLGLGHRFFDEREDFARKHGFGFCTFCAVQRPADHPHRPSRYRPLDDFWRKRGYEKLDGAVTEYRWLDVGSAEETAKPMQFWGRRLA